MNQLLLKSDCMLRTSLDGSLQKFKRKCWGEERGEFEVK